MNCQFSYYEIIIKHYTISIIMVTIAGDGL